MPPTNAVIAEDASGAHHAERDGYRAPSDTHSDDVSPTGPTHPAWPTAAASAFFEGLTQPSLAGLVGTLLLVAAQLVGLCLLVTPEYLAEVDPGYLLDHPTDDFTSVTITAHRLKYSDPQQLAVVYTGSSTVREALYDDTLLAQQLSSAADTPVRFFMAASSWQSLWETAAVLDQLPGGFQGAVVIGVTPGRLARTSAWLERLIEHPHLALDSETLRQETDRAGLSAPTTTGVYLLDHARFFAARRHALWRSVTGPIAYQPHRYAGKPAWSEAHWEQCTEKMNRWMVDFDKTKNENLELLDRIVHRLSRRGIPVVLLETPHQRDRTESICGPWYGTYTDAVRRFAHERNVAYWDLNDDAALADGDFYDWGHLNNPDAQQRFQTTLAQRLRPILVNLAEDH